MAKHTTRKSESTGKIKTLSRKTSRYAKNLERLSADRSFAKMLKGA